MTFILIYSACRIRNIFFLYFLSPIINYTAAVALQKLNKIKKSPETKKAFSRDWLDQCRRGGWLTEANNNGWPGGNKSRLSVGRLIVADSFGDKSLIVMPESQKWLRRRRTSVTGWAAQWLSAQSVFLVAQSLNLFHDTVLVSPLSLFDTVSSNFQSVCFLN